jgi:negative regulator of flagellin synthesis FlgM
MKIEGSGKAVAPLQTAETRPRTPPGVQQTAGSGEKVELSSLSATLRKADAAMAEAPVVDKARVAEIRQAIADGSCKIDAGRIADGLIRDVRDMLGTQARG